ncbi:hypothetical protein AVEN_9709-1 [Araneus ventricosus]|uniref:Uncharacterized protein n=1 Tax=Araneus ventricosus TaxID=182803 RepID=A0A4Y2DZE6_ARAVE|nr:hypothetical protein AVEN_9709-1 [Araneus ventricosus]
MFVFFNAGLHSCHWGLRKEIDSQTKPLIPKHHKTWYGRSSVSRQLPVAVIRTGVRGARLVPQEPRGPQKLFDVQRTAKPTTDLGLWVRERDLNINFCACGLILTKSATGNYTC